MKYIITTEETATSWSPWKVESKKFIQDANLEVFDALIKSIVGPNYSSTVPYVVEGCVITGAGPYAISAGKIFYNGVFYNVPAGTGLAGPIEFQLETTADPVADPTTFSDGSTGHEIHLDYHFTPYGATLAPTPDFDENDLVSVYGAEKIIFESQPVTQNTTSTSFIDLTGATYTTPNDGITRRWLIMSKSDAEFSGSANDGGELRVMVDGVQKAIGRTRIDLPGTVTNFVGGLYCQTFQSIAPNKIIKAQIESIDGGGIDFKNNSFIVMEV